jgi:hypothetical protein
MLQSAFKLLVRYILFFFLRLQLDSSIELSPDTILNP